MKPDTASTASDDTASDHWRCFDFASSGDIRDEVTLIATSLAGNCPLLLGDLLISADAAPGKYQFSLPVQDVEYLGDAPRAITGLALK